MRFSKGWEASMDMRDIAKVAGVSSATVSRVINGSNLVKPVTAERVRRVIADLKFVPNGSATTLKYGRSSTYGLIIPDITNPFFPEFIRSFESILVDHRLSSVEDAADDTQDACPKSGWNSSAGCRD